MEQIMTICLFCNIVTGFLNWKREDYRAMRICVFLALMASLCLVAIRIYM